MCRSCVDHSNHYTTEARPIPDVLIVLLNNVPITMTSYDTHTTRHLSDTPTRTVHRHHRVSPLAPLTWDRCELHQPALFTVTTPHCSPSPPRTVPITSGFDHFRFRSLPVPNPHCSPTNRTDPRATLRRQPALFAAITSGFDHLRFRSLTVPITSGSHLVLFADPLLIWG